MDARERAIEDLYRRKYVRFRNTLATITGSHDSARDAVQEAFTRALRKRRSLRDEQAVEMWVWRIALRTAFEHGRRERRVQVGLSDVAEVALPEPERDPGLAEALRQLPPRRRLIVFLRYFADLTYGEIAELCDVAEGTVAATIAQARAELERTFDRDKVGV
ncbi:MAG TPA: RNA polymerase sigma factor [Gaiellaceae bacterium]|nr:RNA polymerase sigma factor [Gaiellaceae bacterium]